MDLKIILETAPVALHCVSESGIITWANKAALNNLECTAADEYIGRAITEISPESSETLHRFLKLSSSGSQSKGFPLQLYMKSGRIKCKSLKYSLFEILCCIICCFQCC
jgi:transcriptional regulator with PAS, ATPase and Fis domain